MFNKNKAISEEFNGFLGQGTSLTGDLRFSGKLHLDGEFHGTIFTDDVLVVGDKATVEADIKAGEIQISGKVFGNIECARRIEILESGHVRGDVRTPKLIINEGGVFEGKSLAATAQDSRESLWVPDKQTDKVENAVETSAS
ncbi:MAG TPA: polymer-forming cytoskeletal protein [Terriglobia bacterium]|nr:polymer-forming cytoskeletal protein [Terriglobia bacterium]